MATTPENRVKAAIKRWLKDQGIFYWSAAAGPYSVHGISDILAVRDGVLHAIEVKAPGRKAQATPHQLKFIASVRAAGGRAVIADTLADVEELFYGADSARPEGDCPQAEKSRARHLHRS